MIDLDQQYTISVEWVCGCAQYWTVSLPPDPDEVIHRSPEACPPDHCPTCLAAGRLCATREGLRRFSVQPAEFSEITPVRRVVRRKAG